MESRARLLGHPVHPMLVVFPIGLLGTAVIFDLIGLYTHAPHWAGMAYYMIPAGLIGGVLAAVFGFADWTAIPAGTRARRIGAVHGLGNAVVLVLFLASWLLRRGAIDQPPPLAVGLGVAGLVLALVTGWLGGELVNRLGVGVDPGAHLDSPSSLSGRPASDGAPPSGRPANRVERRRSA